MSEELYDEDLPEIEEIRIKNFPFENFVDFIENHLDRQKYTPLLKDVIEKNKFECVNYFQMEVLTLMDYLNTLPEGLDLKAIEGNLLYAKQLEECGDILLHEVELNINTFVIFRQIFNMLRQFLVCFELKHNVLKITDEKNKKEKMVKKSKKEISNLESKAKTKKVKSKL